MAQLTALQVADLWIAAGGPRNRAVEWTAIALGESGYSTDVVSSAGAIGVWQIMPFNAAPHGYSVGQLYDPLINAKVTVAMSGHGTNCAAWDSAYRNINISGRYSFLAWPEPGSADYANLAVVSAQLGRDKLGGAVPPPGSSDTHALAQATAHLNALTTHVYQPLQKLAIAQRMAINATLRPGWRP